MSLEDVGLDLFVRLYRLTTAILLVLPGLALATWARRRVKDALRSGWAAEPGDGETAETLARSMLEREELSHRITWMIAEGPLATFYDPRRGEMRLSEEVARGRSPALLGLAAHEAGHALQDLHGYRPVWVRTPLVFASGLGSRAAWVVILTGVVLDFPELAMRGVVVYLAAVLAAVLLIPIEIDANRRARRVLRAIVPGDLPERSMVATSLRAAVWDHVAATLPLPWSSQPASGRLVRRLAKDESRSALRPEGAGGP